MLHGFDIEIKSLVKLWAATYCTWPILVLSRKYVQAVRRVFSILAGIAGCMPQCTILYIYIYIAQCFWSHYLSAPNLSMMVYNVYSFSALNLFKRSRTRAVRLFHALPRCTFSALLSLHAGAASPSSRQLLVDSLQLLQLHADLNAAILKCQAASSQTHFKPFANISCPT